MRIWKKVLAAVVTVAMTMSLFAGSVVFAEEPSLEGHIVKLATEEEYSTVLGKSVQKEYNGHLSNVYTYGSSGFTANFIGTDFWMYVPSMPDEGENEDGSTKWVSQAVTVLVDTDMPMEATRVTITQPGWYCLASGLEEGTHTITMRKADRGFYGKMAASFIPVSHIATNGEFLTPDPRKDLVIEVYGDSISNGDAVWDNGGTGQAYTYGSYSSVVGRLLGAEIRVTGNSGNGLCGCVIYTANDGEVTNLCPPQNSWSVFDSNFENEKYGWDHKGANAADVVIINLGTNDRAEYGGGTGDLTLEAFYNEYIRFIKEIKTDCPNAMVICALGAMGGINEFGATIQQVVDDANAWNGSEFCYWQELAACNTIDGGLGYDNGHPSNVAHEIYGLQLAKLINEKLDLGIELKEIGAGPYSVNVNLNLEGEYSASSYYNEDHSTAKAFDGNTSTSWQAGENAVVNSWLQVKYTDKKTVGSITITFTESYPTGETKFEYSPDGETWLPLKTMTVNALGTYTIDLDDKVSAKGLKVTFSGTSNSNAKYGTKVTEFEAYEFSPTEFDDIMDNIAVSYVVAQKSVIDNGNKVRLMAAVNSLDYKKIGFEIVVNDDDHTTANTTVWEDNYVYDSIADVSATDLGLKQGYMFALTITDVPADTDINVRAYVIDDSGDKIYGNFEAATGISLVGGMLTVRN